MAHVLFILTAADRLLLNNDKLIPTGFWAQEFVPVHHLFLEHGHQISIATPGGKPAALDTNCFAPEFHHHDPGRILNLHEQLDDITAWRTPLSLERIALTGNQYDALFFPGGHGPTVDLIHSEAAGTLVKRTLSQQGLIGAICHGGAGLIPAQHQDRWLLADYQLTCFSPAEEQLAGLAGNLPDLLADQLSALGGKLSFAPPACEHVVIDRQLYTGQNPASAEKLAYLMARQLKKKSSLNKNSCAAPC